MHKISRKARSFDRMRSNYFHIISFCDDYSIGTAKSVAADPNCCRIPFNDRAVGRAKSHAPQYLCSYSLQALAMNP